MYELILVPLDGSKRAECILPHVEDLSKNSGAKVLLLHVIEPIYSLTGKDVTSSTFFSWTTDEKFETAKNYLEDKGKLLKEHSVANEIRIERGPVVDSIMKVANERKVDIIAMASHGRTGLGRVFYGSVAAGVLHRADRPLLIIRSRNE